MIGCRFCIVTSRKISILIYISRFHDVHEMNRDDHAYMNPELFFVDIRYRFFGYAREGEAAVLENGPWMLLVTSYVIVGRIKCRQRKLADPKRNWGNACDMTSERPITSQPPRADQTWEVFQAAVTLETRWTVPAPAPVCYSFSCSCSCSTSFHSFSHLFISIFRWSFWLIYPSGR